MAKIDDYGLRELIGSDTINHEQQRLRFERTQKALGDFYAWLGLPAAQSQR